MGGLVITRCEGERILIGDHVVVQVLRTQSNRVTLHITAPRSIAVDREEIRHLKRLKELHHDIGNEP